MVANPRINSSGDNSNDFALCISLVKLEGQIPSSLIPQIFPTSGDHGSPSNDLSVGVDLNMKNDRDLGLTLPKERLLSTTLSVVEENAPKEEFASKETITYSKGITIDDAADEDYATVVGVWDDAPVLEQLVKVERQSSLSTSTLSTTGNTFEIPLKSNPTESGFTAQLDLTSVVTPASTCKKRSRQDQSKEALKWGTVELNLAPETLQNLAETVPPPSTNDFFHGDEDDMSQEDTPDVAEPVVHTPTMSLVEALSPAESDHVDMRLPVMFRDANGVPAPGTMMLHLRVKMQNELLLAIRNGVVRAKQVEDDPVMKSASFDPPQSGSQKNRLLGCLGPDFFDLLKHFLCLDNDKESQDNISPAVGSMTCATAFAANDPNAIARTLSISSSIDTSDRYSPGPPFDPKKEVRIEIASWVEPPKVRQDNPFFNESVKA